MQYPSLEKGPAEDILARLEIGQPILDAKVVWKGSGDRFPEVAVTAMMDLLEALTKQSNSHNGDGWGHNFDAAGAAIVHRWTIEQKLSSRTIADQGFWRWLAVVHGYDIIRWRYDNGDAPLKRENFGIKGTRENAFFRMYQIGAVVCDSDAENPYELATSGDVDFWRSHILRQNYANARPIAHTLARLQAGMLEEVPPLKTSEIRELAKDLRRLRANIVFESLSEDCARKLILERVPLARERAELLAMKKKNMKEVPRSADPARVLAGV